MDAPSSPDWTDVAQAIAAIVAAFFTAVAAAAAVWVACTWPKRQFQLQQARRAARLIALVCRTEESFARFVDFTVTYKRFDDELGSDALEYRWRHMKPYYFRLKDHIDIGPVYFDRDVIDLLTQMFKCCESSRRALVELAVASDLVCKRDDQSASNRRRNDLELLHILGDTATTKGNLQEVRRLAALLRQKLQPMARHFATPESR